MESAQDDVQRYLRDMSDYLECLENEHDDAIFEAERLQSDWDIAVQNYNYR